MRNPFRRHRPGPRQVTPGDADHARIMVSLEHPPGPERDALTATWQPAGALDECWVLAGADGSPIGALEITRDPADPELLHAWLAVDPVLRRYGTGEKLFEHLVARARRLGATRIASWADEQSGYAFLADHGFVATNQADDPARPRAKGPVVTGVLTLAELP